MSRALLVAVWTVVGCVPALHSSAPPRALASTSGWVELTSRHFVLRTDLPLSSAQRALTDCERSYAALGTLIFADDPPREPIDLIVFADEADFRSIAPGDSTGYFLPRQVNERDYTPTIAMYGEWNEVTRRRFQHELAHRFLEHHVPDAPPWLAEGIAEFYSTIKLDQGEVVVGLMRNDRVFRLTIRTLGGLTERVVDDRIPLGDAPTVEELLSADFATFHDPHRELAFYATSWALVHMLENDRAGYHARFADFLRRLAAGERDDRAWLHSFGDVPLPALDRELGRYIVRVYLDQRTQRLPAVQVPPLERQRALRPDELALLRARIRPWDCRENILMAGRDLERARSLELELGTAGESAELHYWRSLYLSRWRRFDAAERELGQALTRAPDNPRYWLALATLLTRDDRLPVPPERVARAIAELEARASSPQALDFLARYYGESGEVELGLPLARRAVALSPSCRECAATLSDLDARAKLRRPTGGWVYPLPTIR
jgi:tetratricopeptide (TPR) repeat protein